MKKTELIPADTEMMSEIEKFIHESMCVEGTVKYDSETIILTKAAGIKKCIVFEINDKRRGQFFIVWSK